MARTIPVYVNVDTITSASISDGSETAAASITTNSGAVADGLLWGVHGKLSSTAGAVIVRVYSDESKTSELYKVTLDFSGSVTNASDLMSAAIPLFENPAFTIEGDATSASKTCNLTFYIQAISY